VSDQHTTSSVHEVNMEFSLAEKAAAFCRSLDDGALRVLANQEDMEQVFLRAEISLRTGMIGSDLESDLDALDAMVMGHDGQGMYPTDMRGYTPLPMASSASGAWWWSCPTGRCSGRGRVLPGHVTPVCAVTGDELVARPLSE
jgi:hypothetical protein